MNWSRASAYLMTGEHGYKVAKFITEGHAVYRASRGGVFIGSPQDSFDDAAAVCESNFAIMGSDWEAGQ